MLNKRVKKILYAIIIAFAVISFWRGVWGLMDIFLFPNDMLLSLGSSFIIGLVILIFTRNAIKKLI